MLFNCYPVPEDLDRIYKSRAHHLEALITYGGRKISFGMDIKKRPTDADIEDAQRHQRYP